MDFVRVPVTDAAAHDSKSLLRDSTPTVRPKAIFLSGSIPPADDTFADAEAATHWR
jgi:hypothetical protein